MANSPITAVRIKSQITRFSSRVSRELDKPARKSHFPSDVEWLEANGGKYRGFVRMLAQRKPSTLTCSYKTQATYVCKMKRVKSS